MNSRLRTSLLLLAVGTAIFALQATAVDPAMSKQTTQTTTSTTHQSGAAQTPVPIRRVSCVVQGDPTEFPNDLYIKNTGNGVIPKGWIVNWSIPGTSPRQGHYSLTADLAVGAGVYANDQLPGGYTAGVKADCTCSEPPAFSPANPPKLSVKQPLPVIAQFDCVVQGSPVEFPDDVLITNKLTTTVAKGKTIHWSVPSTTRQGDWVLTEDLLAGKSVFVTGAIPGGMSAGVKCDAKLK